MFNQEPGHHEVCPICLWEDELGQLRFPNMPGLSNCVSLAEAQLNYLQIGVAERKNAGKGRQAFPEERLDEGWRPVNPDIDNLEEPARGIDYANTYPWRDTSVLYYWRPTYWRRVVG